MKKTLVNLGIVALLSTTIYAYEIVDKFHTSQGTGGTEYTIKCDSGYKTYTIYYPSTYNYRNAENRVHSSLSASAKDACSE